MVDLVCFVFVVGFRRVSLKDVGVSRFLLLLSRLLVVLLLHFNQKCLNLKPSVRATYTLKDCRRPRSHALFIKHRSLEIETGFGARIERHITIITENSFIIFFLFRFFLGALSFCP